jgi:hypothetical protein
MRATDYSVFDTGSREENASKQKPGASVLIESKPMLQAGFRFLPSDACKQLR